MKAAARAALVAAIAVACACGGGPGKLGPPRTQLSAGAQRPSLSVVERDGDASGAIAIAVTTEGIAPDRGAAVAIALGTLIEERLAARGLGGEATVTGGWDGWRLRGLASSPEAAARLVDAAREAMLAPVAPQDPALPAIARRVGALGRRLLPDPSLIDVVRCTGEAFGTRSEPAPTDAEVESWRRAAHGLGRVALASAGGAALADVVAGALARGPAWPSASAIPASSWPAADAPPAVYDASGELVPGAARIVVTARTSVPERAAAAARVLGDPRGALASRLSALDAPARVRAIVATAHADGGCVAATIDVGARDLVADASVRLATAAALARQEIAIEAADVDAPADYGRALATRAADPRDAAELAAWWTLAGRRPGDDALRVSVAIGVAAPKDAHEPALTAASVAAAQAGSESVGATGARSSPPLAEAVRAELDRAETAWRAPVVESRTRVERGQGEAWVLVGSPCGTLAESTRDAGASATAALAAALQAGKDAADAQVEPFVAADGIGVVAHGAARPGESPTTLARRLGDLAARPFVSDTLDPERVARARTTLLGRTGLLSERALAALGAGLAPNHPSWVDPLGTTLGLGSISDAMIAVRTAALRAGPLRVAVLANADSAQAEAAVRAVDRWVARRPGETRSCPAGASLTGVHAGTYAVELPAGAAAEALIAVPIPPGDPAAHTAARWIAAALDGPSGLLAR
ncbi:MAG: hypothetical protein JOZ69_00115, partial [Myxococcales bacterium]|nr:hypothetical protein [Myxococcales bacterium]